MSNVLSRAMSSSHADAPGDRPVATPFKILLRSSVLFVDLKSVLKNSRSAIPFCPSQKIASPRMSSGIFSSCATRWSVCRATSRRCCDSAKIAFFRTSSSFDWKMIESRAGMAASACDDPSQKIASPRTSVLGSLRATSSSVGTTDDPRFCAIMNTARLRSSTRHGSRCLSTASRIGMASSEFMLISPSSAAMRISSSAREPVQPAACRSVPACLVMSDAAFASPSLACSARIWA